MNKYILCVLFFLIFNSINAQFSYQINYKLSISFVEENAIKDKYLKYAIKGADELFFQLNFNKTKSEFIETNNSKSNLSTIAKAWCDYLNPIFTDLEKKIYYYNNPKSPYFEKNTYLIYKEVPMNWEITSDYKMINNLKCYKAKTRYQQGGKEKIITAWYCSEIPYSVGPMGYSGLPGAILELQMDNLLFGAHSINKLNTEQIIDFPKVGKIISEVDYLKLIN